MGAEPRVEGWTYARAGVDRSSVAKAVQALRSGIRYRPPPSSGRAVELSGHYAGLVRIGRETLAITTDTVGTKSLLAEELGRWEEVGEDIVAVNVNDLSAVGARPVGLVDCISGPRVESRIFEQIGRGLDRGLRAARCSLLGGETAVVRDLVRGFDLGGTAIGYFPRSRRPVTGSRIRPGDQLIGVPSSGLHANGFTLARAIVQSARQAWIDPRPGTTRPLGVELLTPSRIYVSAVEAIAGEDETTGLAHISGGGVRNLVRLNSRVRFRLSRWPELVGLFRWMEEAGNLRREEAFQTFNMGIGFVIVRRPRGLSAFLRKLSRAGAPDAVSIGEVVSGTGVELPQFGIQYGSYS